MPGILSNGLWLIAQASQPTTAPVAREYPAWFMMAMAVGVVLGLIWLARRIAFPGKFTLARTPARANDIHPVVLLMLLVLFFGLNMGAAGLFGRWLDEQRAMVIGTCVGQAAFIAAGLAVVARLFRNGLWRGLGLTARHWQMDGLRGVVGLLIALPVCFGLLELTNTLIHALLSGNLERIEELTKPHEFLTAFAEQPAPWRVMVFLAVAVLAPLSEEILFRGFVQSTIRQLTGRPWVGILITSALFALVHGQWNARPALFALAVILGYNYERTGRLLPSIVIHTLFNAANLLMSA